MTERPALLLGGGPIAVPICRSLARAGVQVRAFGTSDDPVRLSRFCHSFVDLGSFEGVQQRWLEWFTTHPCDGSVLLPCNDDALELIARHRKTLLALGYLPLDADDDAVLALLDKEKTYALAREAGVPTPATIVLGPDADPHEIGRTMRFPLALKPRQAHVYQRIFGGSNKLVVVNDLDELRAHGEALLRLGLEMLVTELIPGPDDACRSYYSFVDERGEIVAEATKRKLRQFPIGYGLTTYHVMEHHEETRALGRRFCSGVGVRGVSCVEFKHDSRDGQLKLIECNSRFTAGNELIRHAGLDLALLAYRRATGQPDPPRRAVREGLRMWHPVEDVRSRRPYGRRDGLTRLGWARSVMHRQHFPMFSLRDPAPSLGSASRFPRAAWRRLAGGWGAESGGDPAARPSR